MAAYAVEMLNITKIFGGTVVANDDITIRVKKGEIHALVGENGAGKSTIMSILFGLYEPTSGTIKINGETTFIDGPIKANRLGIGMVHQHFKLVEINTVWQNIAMGAEEVSGKIFVNGKKIKSRIQAICDKYNLHVDLNARIENISVGMQQRVEILKILYRGADILVFDEPTAVLTPQEIEGLLEIMLKLQQDGKTIIFISHKLNEIKAVANTATVIRLGKVIDEFNVADVTEDQLAEAMVGRKLVEIKNPGGTPSDEVMLDVRNLTVKKIGNPKLKGLKDFSVKVHAGEIVAIAGVEGNGQQELVSAISGLVPAQSGQVWFKDISVEKRSIHYRYENGMSHIPEDRQKHGLVMDFSIIDNMVLQNVDEFPFSRFGFISRGAIQNYAQGIVHKFDVRGSQNGFEVARSLSGGNQQKAIVGRELSRKHNILLVVQPTRGLDVGAIEYIHSQILEERKKGYGVLLVSYELEEVLALADRIVVMNKGQRIGEVKGSEADRKEIGLMMAGKYVEHKPKAVTKAPAKRKGA